MTRSRYRIYENYYPYFLTATIVGWLPVFTRKETVQIVLNSWRFLAENNRLTIYGFVILENHLHLVASSENLTKEIGDFKSYTARMIIDHLSDNHVETLLKQLKYNKARHKDDREFQVWQEGSHPQQIQNADIMRQKLDYMHNNPVERGYVARPEHWLYSSAANYWDCRGFFPSSRIGFDDVGDWSNEGTQSVKAVRSHAERGNEE